MQPIYEQQWHWFEGEKPRQYCLAAIISVAARKSEKGAGRPRHVTSPAVPGDRMGRSHDKGRSIDDTLWIEWPRFLDQLTIGRWRKHAQELSVADAIRRQAAVGRTQARNSAGQTGTGQMWERIFSTRKTEFQGRFTEPAGYTQTPTYIYFYIHIYIKI